MKIKALTKKRKRQIKKFFKDFWEVLWKPEMAVLPGQLAFFTILSLVPIITLIGYGASFFNLSIDSVIDALQANFSPGIVKMVAPIIGGEALDLNLLIVFAVMFYIASNGANSIIITSNEIYNISQPSWLKRRIKAIIITIILILLYLFILLVPVFGSKIIDAIDYFRIKSVITSVLASLQGPISWLIIFIFIKVIYALAPNKPLSSFKLNLGAAFTTFGWVVTTYVYSYYINHFASYDLFYAGLSNIAILMLWIYFLSYIFVIGMSLNYKATIDELEIIGSKTSEN